jgi:hypothetical protein
MCDKALNEGGDMITTLRVVFAIFAFVTLIAAAGIASEQPGPSGSVGGSGKGSGGPSGKGGVPQGQTPVDPRQEGSGIGTPPEPGSGKMTQNPPEESTGKKGTGKSDDKGKGKTK